MKSTVTYRAIAKKTHRNLFAPAELRGESGTRPQRHAGAYNSVGTQKAVLGFVDMHATSSPPITSVGFAPDLGEHRSHRNAFGDRVSVAPVGTGDVVVLVQMAANSSTDGLLSHV